MFDVIKRSVNTNLNKPLDTLIMEKSTETNGKIDSKASQTSVTSMDTKVGVTSDAAGTASAGTLFGKMNKLLTDWTTARAAKIDTIATDVTSLKTSVVNGKQAVVNAINGSLGYASGLTTNHPFSDYAWWIQNKVNGVKDIAFERMMSMYAAGYFCSNTDRDDIPHSLNLKITGGTDGNGKACDIITLPAAGSYILVDGGLVRLSTNPPADNAGSISVISEVENGFGSGNAYYGSLVKVITPGKFYNLSNTNYSGYIRQAIYLTPDSMRWLKGEI